MPPFQNFVCLSFQAGQAKCSYGCTSDRILCHDFFDDKCSVRAARYCAKGWHERIQYDSKLQYQAKVSSTTELANERPEVRLRSVDPSRKPAKRARSEKPVVDRPSPSDTDTEEEIQTTISLCQLKLFEGIPQRHILENAYKRRMLASRGNPKEKDLTTEAFKIVSAYIGRRDTK